MKDIYWIRHDDLRRLAIVARPRGDDWLEDDLANLKRGGIDVLISLLTPDEAADLGLRDEAVLAESIGLQFISYPISDRTTPTYEESFRRLAMQLAQLAKAGKRIGAHCCGCIGRSTVLIAAILIQVGIEPAEAIGLIEHARGCVVPDTPEQLQWILNFKPAPSKPDQ
ncbi:MAG: dual specificity protein phosphatase family protein [Silvibacterium sp.]|nr:dual specificity protein phosphatase family protein [Silvibacterium sp.]MBV8437411.1 dual specificity protein phosphatase family protein [Silvibacterium sp.]